MTRLRDDYLFDLAAVCHVPPYDVDRLTVQDLTALCNGIEVLRREQAAAEADAKKAAAATHQSRSGRGR